MYSFCIQQVHGMPETTSDIVCDKSATHEVVSQAHATSDTTPDIVCMKSAAYKAVSHKPPIYDYVLVSNFEPKLSSGGSRSPHGTGTTSLDAPAVLPDLDRRKLA